MATAASALAALILPASGLAATGERTFHPHDGDSTVEGSGRVVKQERPIAPFRRIKMLGAERVVVRIGSKSSLVIAADDNVLPLIKTEVRGGTLRVVSRDSYRSRRPVTLWLTTPNLEAYQSLGSGDATIVGLDNERLSLTLTGSGNVRAKGRTRELVLTIAGSGKADLAGLIADSIQVALHGGGGAMARRAHDVDPAALGSAKFR